MFTKKFDVVLVLTIQIIFIVLFLIFATYDEKYDYNSYPSKYKKIYFACATEKKTLM